MTCGANSSWRTIVYSMSSFTSLPADSNEGLCFSHGKTNCVSRQSIVQDLGGHCHCTLWLIGRPCGTGAKHVKSVSVASLCGKGVVPVETWLLGSMRGHAVFLDERKKNSLREDPRTASLAT